MKVEEKAIRKKFNKLNSNNIPKPNLLKHCFNAFWVGGLICVIGQFISDIFSKFGVPKDELGTYVSIVMVFLGAALTGIGVYDKLGDFAGAGSVVPITGFANSIVSPAMEFKKEGFVFGVAAKMFTIAGPVLVYGIGSSVIVGILYYFLRW
ncbi:MULTISPECIES: stage V sporulation protein AC [Clostridium]|uniref:Stage V sporulation protein AC n=1 Tax=Clostridium frigoriphilum TaxID=443253 RepID=A0ABU7UP99_9CLOT|nr:stage V sporulation protein AC [Clostridium sp. DSM 17811]MBU3100309.1 stage V sporulation protein AC [Clostridium sp. DSM 17811]